MLVTRLSVPFTNCALRAFWGYVFDSQEAPARQVGWLPPGLHGPKYAREFDGISFRGPWSPPHNQRLFRLRFCFLRDRSGRLSRFRRQFLDQIEARFPGIGLGYRSIVGEIQQFVAGGAVGRPARQPRAIRVGGLPEM